VCEAAKDISRIVEPRRRRRRGDGGEERWKVIWIISGKRR
jgi:hypothetical protein